MKELLRFRIYYSDGTTYDCQSALSGFQAPPKRVLVVKEGVPDSQTGYTIRRFCVYYTWERFRTSYNKPIYGWRWGGKDDKFGLADYLDNQWDEEWKGATKILLGIEVADCLFDETMKKVREEGCLCCEGNHKW